MAKTLNGLTVPGFTRKGAQLLAEEMDTTFLEIDGEIEEARVRNPVAKSVLGRVGFFTTGNPAVATTDYALCDGQLIDPATYPEYAELMDAYLTPYASRDDSPVTGDYGDATQYSVSSCPWEDTIVAVTGLGTRNSVIKMDYSLTITATEGDVDPAPYREPQACGFRPGDTTNVYVIGRYYDGSNNTTYLSRHDLSTLAWDSAYFVTTNSGALNSELSNSDQMHFSDDGRYCVIGGNAGYWAIFDCVNETVIARPDLDSGGGSGIIESNCCGFLENSSLFFYWVRSDVPETLLWLVDAATGAIQNGGAALASGSDSFFFKTGAALPGQDRHIFTGNDVNSNTFAPGYVEVWNSATLTFETSFDAGVGSTCQRCDISPDGTKVLLGGYSGTFFNIRDAVTLDIVYQPDISSTGVAFRYAVYGNNEDVFGVRRPDYNDYGFAVWRFDPKAPTPDLSAEAVPGGYNWYIRVKP